jgi:hypothetical protein
MSLDIAKLDEHIEQLREGNTLTENEVRALCDKVRGYHVASFEVGREGPEMTAIHRQRRLSFAFQLLDPID